MADDEKADEDFTWRGVVRRKRPGRPRGSQNRYAAVQSTAAAQETIPDEIRIPDLADLIAEQLRMIGRAQRALGKADRLAVKDLRDLSAALDQAVAAVSRAAKSQEDILSRMSQSQLAEAAIRRLEDADPSTRALALRRIRAKQNETVPEGPARAVDALRNL
jgi:hypothetical protein